MSQNKHYMKNGTEIYLPKGYPIEKAIKKLSKKMQKFGIIKDYWRTRVYMSPSEKRKYEKSKALLSAKRKELLGQQKKK